MNTRLLQPRSEGLYDPRFEHEACGIGFIADVRGRKSHEIVRDAVQILVKLTHRGATGADPECGDGAGILMQMPDAFLRTRCADLGFELPAPGRYGAGTVFLPRKNAGLCLETFERVAVEEGCRVLGWRDVPHEISAAGGAARKTCPLIKQVFIAGPDLQTAAFERRLYLVRRLVEKAVASSDYEGADSFYIVGLSARTLNYKGMLMAHQIRAFYPDLEAEDLTAAVAVVHQRYSTNTFPSWPLAQPFRILCHNGEINTLRGNINKMLARQASMSSSVWGADLQRLFPVIQNEDGSDSACFDNVLELLYLSGRSLPHAVLMMMPEAWGDKYYMGHDRRGFYEYHANLMEPWDGPAAIAFTDGEQVGAILDRNGLRPARWLLTDNDRVILASETGVLDLPPSETVAKGRLQPGKMFLVDTAAGRVVLNDEIKAEICRSRHYRRWVAANRIEFQGFGGLGEVDCDAETLLTRQAAFGYTREDTERLIRPMVETGAEPIGSMGNDAPLAVFSDRPQLLFNYFKQNFAQVTNPPIDPIRERLVMSLTTFLGREGNLLEELPEAARRLKLFTPLLTNEDLVRIRNSNLDEFRCVTLDATFTAEAGEEGLEERLDELEGEAEKAVRDGVTVLALSDRRVSPERAAIPCLLALAAVGSRLTAKGLRSRAGLVLESGEPREVNHFALLLAYGADAVNPYVAIETVMDLYASGKLTVRFNHKDAVANYVHAVDRGILKILSKMGISTLRSYCGARVYEALGLSREFVDRYFARTVSRLGGIGVREVAREALARHREAFGRHRGRLPTLPVGGNYAYRRDGERHAWSPEAICLLQRAVRTGEVETYERFARLVGKQPERPTTIRHLLAFRTADGKPLPLEEVEPASEIVKRFMTGAMSFGSLGREAHETLARAMNRLGGMSNSGEGGEDPARYVPGENGESRSSAVKQVASGRFGVTAEYLVNAKELQIKIAQGAKPGEGGHLPGHKVIVEIAKVRHSTPGVSLISPPPHHDIYSIEDLAQLIYDLRNINPRARISVKLVSEAGVGTIAAGVAKGKADMVLISGGDGGTGASPLSSIKYAGLPWELGLAETHQTLVRNGLRDRIRVQTDGQMRTGRDVAVAALLGAEEFGFGTAALVALGCVMMRKCHKNTCPVGIATQDPRLRRRFRGAPEHVVAYFYFVAEELRRIMASLGLRTVTEMVGRSDLLEPRTDITHWKARTLNLRPILAVAASAATATGVNAKTDANVKVNGKANGNGVFDALNLRLVEDAKPALKNGEKVEHEYEICNVNRAVGALLSHHIAVKYGREGLPDDTVVCRFKGSAGQSFGAFAAKGLTMILEGDANDYLGKGLSGGRLIVKAPADAAFDPAENIAAGNTILYGATAGEVYIDGLAGERFCVRNSGARAVVDGVGDHGCEYMTGGVAAVLGRTGVNFAAGMSGGIAYVYDPRQDFDLRCNLDMVDLEPVRLPADVRTLRKLLEDHLRYTGSARAAALLADWTKTRTLFVKVMPVEYRRALGQMAEVERNARKTEEEKIEQD